MTRKLTFLHHGIRQDSPCHGVNIAYYAIGQGLAQLLLTRAGSPLERGVADRAFSAGVHRARAEIEPQSVISFRVQD